MILFYFWSFLLDHWKSYFSFRFSNLFKQTPFIYVGSLSSKFVIFCLHSSLIIPILLSISFCFVFLIFSLVVLYVLTLFSRILWTFEGICLKTFWAVILLLVVTAFWYLLSTMWIYERGEKTPEMIGSAISSIYSLFLYKHLCFPWWLRW